MGIRNEPAPGVSYYTPLQSPPSGTAFDPQPDGKPIPTLFQPLRIRGLEFQNRIFLSPLCQYSADDGHLTAWQQAHLGGIFTRGPGLATVEATTVLAEGRITPQDSGLWKDSQIEPLRKIVEFAHSQGQKMAIQLGHAGRKASMVAPWLSYGAIAPVEDGGWPDDVWAPSAIQFGEGYPNPKELTKEGIQEFKDAFVAATHRALKAGFDVIEIHGAHGYLLNSFMSPYSNKRTDEYGGSFENRIRLSLEIVDAVRAVIPESMPLFFRVSATDWLDELFPDEPSWTINDTIKLAPILYEHGVDLIDNSAGGVGRKQKTPPMADAYQAYLAEAVKKSLVGGPAEGLLVATVGGIRSGKVAQAQLDLGRADVVFVGRQFQKDPSSVWTFAEDLGVSVKVANQIEWGFRGRAGIPKKH